MRKKKSGDQQHEDILNSNQKIDVATVSDFRRLERELNRLGVEIIPRYGVEPPLGSSRTVTHNRIQ